MKELATAICRFQHHHEWVAAYPRINPCTACFLLAEAVHAGGWRKP